MNLRSLAAPIGEGWRYRSLVMKLASRELTEQYSGQIIGRAWAVLHTLIVCLVFVFIFGVILKTKVGDSVDLPRDYTTYLLSGLVVWLPFQQLLIRATTLLVGHANLVKQVVFPLDVLPIKLVLASLLPILVGMAVLMAYILFKQNGVPWTVVMVPVLIVILLVAMLGLAQLLAAAGVFLRDLKEIASVVSLIGVYCLPIVYLPSWIPSSIAPFIMLNPLSATIFCFQDAFYYGRFEHPIAWIVFPVVSIIFFVAGSLMFERSRPYFANFL